MASSPPACDALLQINEAALDKALEFAHALQEAHFAEDRDLNDPRTYPEVLPAFGLPAIPTDHWTDQAVLECRLSSSFCKSSSFGINSFPSCVLVTDKPWMLLCTNQAARPASFVRRVLDGGWRSKITDVCQFIQKVAQNATKQVCVGLGWRGGADAPKLTWRADFSVCAAVASTRRF